MHALSDPERVAIFAQIAGGAVIIETVRCTDVQVPPRGRRARRQQDGGVRRVIAFDPYVSVDRAKEMGVEVLGQILPKRLRRRVA